MEYQCGSCGDSYDTAVSHYTCGANPTHNLCIVCFGVFAAHCCSAAAGGLSILIPMTCFIPSCKSLIPDNEISRLLQDETIKEQRLWDRYLKSQLMVALNGQIQNSSAEIPITCSFCNEYIEMYAPVEAVVWEKQQKKLESELEEELVKVRIEIEAETAKRFEGRKDELNSQIEHLKRQYLDEGGSEDDHKTLLENIARMGFRGDEFDIFLMEIKEKKYESVDTTSINTEVVVDFINAYEFTELSDTQWESLKKYYLFSMKEASIFLNIKERISSITKEIIAVEENRRSEISTKVQAYKSEFFKRRREAMIVLPDKPSESSQFFMCRNASCMGAFCLRCEVFLTKDAILDHICQIDAVHELYKEVLHILAENSTRRCPTCGQMWRKDLECNPQNVSRLIFLRYTDDLWKVSNQVLLCLWKS